MKKSKNLHQEFMNSRISLMMKSEAGNLANLKSLPMKKKTYLNYMSTSIKLREMTKLTVFILNANQRIQVENLG
jgi:hypothetical protein